MRYFMEKKVVQLIWSGEKVGGCFVLTCIPLAVLYINYRQSHKWSHDFP